MQLCLMFSYHVVSCSFRNLPISGGLSSKTPRRPQQSSFLSRKMLLEDRTESLPEKKKKLSAGAGELGSFLP